jgi:4-diphosphocytidyl-2-C-methyl-D-erythritol kinase
MWYFYSKLNVMIVFPNAKINIGLRITGKRADGYHDIETVFYPVGLSDALEFVVSGENPDKDILNVTGLETGSKTYDNIVTMAVISLREKHSFPFLRVHLHKSIPVGAGLGGGSSDAACMLKAINKHFELNLDNSTLKSLALRLGSDCPFFMDGIPSLAAGRGEILTTVKPVLSGYWMVLLNPGVGINTGEAYQNCKPIPVKNNLEELIMLPVIEWKGLILNDFEDFAFKKQPIIGEIKEELYRSNALFSLMSGSGSSVYGIFSKKPGLPRKLKELVIWEGVM